MSGNYNKIKGDLLDSELKRKLSFTREDRQKVFSQLNKDKTNTRGINNYKLKNILPKVAVPVLTATFLMVGSLILLPQLEGLNDVTNKGGLSEISSGSGDNTTTSDEIFETITENGISLTVNNVSFDGKFIYLHYTAESDSKIVSGNNMKPDNLNIEVDGKKIDFKLEGFGDHVMIPHEEEVIAQLKPKVTLPDSFQFDVAFKRIGKTEGNWKFSVPVSKADNLVREIKPNVTASYDKTNTQISINEVKFTPTETQIYTSVKNPIYFTDMVQKVISGGYQTYMKYEVTNEFNEVIPVYKTLSENFSPILTLAPTRDINSLPKSLTVKTIVMKDWGESYEKVVGNLEKSEPLSKQTPFLVEQEKNAGIRVNKIEKKESEIWIYYDIEGNLPFYRNSIYLKVDGDETEINPTNRTEMNYTERNHIAKFKVDAPLESLRVGTMITDYREIKELEINIPIK